MADKPLQSLNFPGRNYTYVNTPLSTAPTFDNTVAYSIGDYVFYNRKLYKFISAHSIGDWNSSQVEEVTIGNEIKEIENDLSQKYTKPSTGIPASDLAQGVIPEVPVTDVKVNGTSVLGQDGVANVPMASVNNYGVVLLHQEYGTMVTGGKLTLVEASVDQIKEGVRYYRPIMPERQHMSTFYGLAKAAGADEKYSTLPVGTYTDEAKIAIQKMLGTAGNSDIAYIETGVVAQRAYKAGDYFVDSDGILSKATDAIASGGSLVLDTNYEHVGGQGGLANDLFKPAELVADVTVGADIPSSVLSIPLSKPCRHLVIDMTNNNSALPSWSYIRLNRAYSAPALQVNAGSTSVKRAYCVIDLINKVGITLLKNSSDSYANAGQITFDSREYILNTSVAEEIGFSFTNGMIEGFNIKVYGR